MTGKQETARAKFEDDLAPTANHSSAKDLRKLHGWVTFCWPDRNCSSTAATRIMKEYEAASRSGGTYMCGPKSSRAWGKALDYIGETLRLERTSPMMQPRTISPKKPSGYSLDNAVFGYFSIAL
jgi:hypothetical protein